MRAGDGDREATAARLKQALDDGRLDLHEYDERLQKAFAAKTYADLDGLTTDLPGTIPVERSRIQPAAAPVSEPPAGGGGPAPWLRGYGGVVAVCVLIWGITVVSAGHFIYPWPVWMLIPLIFGFVGNKNQRRDRRGRRR